MRSFVLPLPVGGSGVSGFPLERMRDTRPSASNQDGAPSEICRILDRRTFVLIRHFAAYSGALRRAASGKTVVRMLVALVALLAIGAIAAVIPPELTALAIAALTVLTSVIAAVIVGVLIAPVVVVGSIRRGQLESPQAWFWPSRSSPAPRSCSRCTIGTTQSASGPRWEARSACATACCLFPSSSRTGSRMTATPAGTTSAGATTEGADGTVRQTTSPPARAVVERATGSTMIDSSECPSDRSRAHETDRGTRGVARICVP